ncbi:MAG: hypothetical protein K5910_06140 [Bacteroidales bacterium]|nr:hypothetical protein [Bacteroidales bacterium]
MGGLYPVEPAANSVTGVWESGNYFISFSPRGFLVAYADKKFIDSGPFVRESENVIFCINPYFSRTTKYEIRELDGQKMKVTVYYTDIEGTEKTKLLTLTRTDKVPAEKNSPLIGKSESYYGTPGDGIWNVSGNIQHEFLTYNTGRKSVDTGRTKEYPLDFFYIFNGENAYIQYFSPSGVSIPDWAWLTSHDTGKITVYRITFSSEGDLHLFNITDKAL